MNWAPRTNGSQGHAKFVMLWSDDYRDGHLANFLNWNYTSYRPKGFITYSYPTGTESSGPQKGDLPSAPGVEHCLIPDPNRDLGRWMNIITRIKFSNPGKSEGIFQIWKDGKLILDKQNLPNDLKNGKGGANHTYILGPSQYGFNVDTSIYIDNLAISNKSIK